MSLDKIVDVTISVESFAPSRAGFGTPLIVAYHTAWMDLVREYSAPADMITDGFDVDDPAYRMAQIMWAQEPHPTKFKVGRRALAFTQQIDLTVVNVTEDFVYSFDITHPDAVTVTNISYTVLAAATPTTVATAIAALITAVSGLTAASAAAVITVDADNAGDLWGFTMGTLDPKDDMILEDTTSDPGIAADLAAIYAADSDWYGMCLDSNSANEVKAAATWVESLKRIMVFNSSDGEIIDSAVSDDVFSAMQTLSQGRSIGLYSEHKLLNWSGAAWLSRMLPTDPGTATWSFKNLPNVQADTNLKDAFKTQIENKGGNWYAPVAGRNITFEGKAPDGEYMDITRFIDFLHARIQEDVFAVLANADKIPFTNVGAEAIAGAVRGRLRANVSTETDAKGLAADPAPLVTVPDVNTLSTSQRISRTLPDVNFSAQLAGAIHKVIINGKITV
jgi:hypothetical protein